MKTERIRDLFMPWSGLALGTTGYFLAHQLGSDSTFQDCRAGSPLIVTIGTITGLIIIGIGALGSWRIYADKGEGQARRMIAIVGLLTCALYAIAAILPFIAAMVIPRCWR